MVAGRAFRGRFFEKQASKEGENASFTLPDLYALIVGKREALA